LHFHSLLFSSLFSDYIDLPVGMDTCMHRQAKILTSAHRHQAIYEKLLVLRLNSPLNKNKWQGCSVCRVTHQRH